MLFLYRDEAFDKTTGSTDSRAAFPGHLLDTDDQPGNMGPVLVSDQGASRFQVFSREGVKNIFDHQLLKVVDVSARQSDGSEVVALPLGPDFPRGLFVAMSNDRTFHLYKWEDIAGKDLKSIQ